MSEENIVDFGAITAEVENQQDDVTEITSEGHSVLDDFLADLDECIEKQDIKELSLDGIPMSGIQREEQAEFFIHRYKQLKQECEDIDTAANNRIKEYGLKVNAWREGQLKKRQNTMAYYENVLENYAQANISGKKKSISLIEGTLSFSKQQPEYDVNKDKVREYLLKLGEKEQEKFLEPVPQKVKWADLKKAGKLDDHYIFRYGKDAVPGVVVTQRPDKFVIK